MSDILDVVIVGGGVSGLQAALSLKQHGFSKVVVLEARDRVGGRTAVEDMVIDGKAYPVDIGGQWVGPNQKRVNVLLKKYGLRLLEQFDEGGNVLEVQGKQIPYHGKISELKNFAPGELERVWQLLDRMALQVDIHKPWESCGASDMDGVTFRNWLQKNCDDAITRWLVEWFATVCLATDPKEVSLLYFLQWLRSGGGYESLVDIKGGAQNHIVDGGMQQLSECMTKELGGDAVVHLGSAVKRVEQQQETGICEVRYVQRGANKVLRCRRVIMAMSPPLCNKIAFSPPLSEARRHLAADMDTGKVIKVLVGFRKPFWREMGMSGEFISDVGPLSLAYDRSHNGLHALVAFCAGPATAKWGALTKEERMAQVLEQFGRIFKCPDRVKKEFAAYTEHDWSKEEYSEGCYFAYPKLHAIMRWQDALYAPCGRVHFAGTETAIDFIGYIEGSLDSGERVAKEIAALEKRAKL